MSKKKLYLIKQSDNYYSIQNNTLALLGIPTDDIQKEQWFNDYGVDDLKNVLLSINNLQGITTNAVKLDDGNLFIFNLDILISNFKNVNIIKIINTTSKLQYEINDIVTFQYTGEFQEFLLPIAIKKLNINCQGGRGGISKNVNDSTFWGQYGCVVSGNYIRKDNENHTLFVNVGGVGGNWNNGYRGGYPDGTYSGGGGSSSVGAGTGGSSSVYLDNKESLLITADGGTAGWMNNDNDSYYINNYTNLEEGEIIKNGATNNDGKIIMTILDLNYKYLIKDKNSKIYTYNGTKIIEAPNQIINDDNFNNNGFNNVTMITEDLWNDTFPDKTGLQLLMYGNDTNFDKANINCNVDPYKLINKLDDKFEIRMMELNN